MKPFPHKCGICKERGLAPATIDYATQLEYDGKLYDLRLLGLQVLRCEKCGTVVLPDAADDRVSDALREAAGILTPRQIREARQSLGLSTGQLAASLAVPETFVERWEDGGQIQRRAQDILLRLFFKLPEVRRELGRLQESNGTTKTSSSAAQPLAS
jgi:putative zinc finger/helix-turn-helix YgiT family protein